MNDTVDDMLANHQANSWSELTDDSAVYDDERASALERLEAYIDHCFEAYPIVSRHLERSRVQACVADWDRRRGQCRNNKWMDQQVFGKQVRRSHERHDPGCHVIFMAKALIGIPPEDDRGVGWKATTRHELGHAIDYERRGCTDHSRGFKYTMSKFGEETNDGMSQHGWAPSHFK